MNRNVLSVRYQVVIVSIWLTITSDLHGIKQKMIIVSTWGSLPSVLLYLIITAGAAELAIQQELRVVSMSPFSSLKSVSLHVLRVDLRPATDTPTTGQHWMCVMCSCDLLDTRYLQHTQTGTTSTLHADTLHAQTHWWAFSLTHTHTHIAKLRQLKKRSHEGRTVRNEIAGGRGDGKPSDSCSSRDMSLMDWW